MKKASEIGWMHIACGGGSTNPILNKLMKKKLKELKIPFEVIRSNLSTESVAEGALNSKDR